MDESRQILARLEKVEQFMRSLQSAHTIPFPVDAAFRDRLAESSRFDQSSKAINSEDVSINEAGASSHIVLDDPDYFLRAKLADGTEVAIPAYNL